MIVESTAPCRIDLAGGTLDIYPLYLFEEGGITGAEYPSPQVSSPRAGL